MEDNDMKKIYLQPATDVIRIEKALLTVTSSVGLNDTEVSDDTKLLSRDFDFDDEDW